MSVNKPHTVVIFTLALLILTGCTSAPRDTVHQHSTIDALLAGVYDGSLTLKELSRYGDFGIGTFNRLDGEMLMLDNEIFQIRSDGKVYAPPLTMTTPFASVCYFNPEQNFKLRTRTDFKEIKQQIEKITGNPNLFYAIRITGHFRSMRTRSVPAQTKPYPDLKTVAANQPEFQMQDIDGVIFGFKCPEYVKGINVPGCHLHFLSNDRKQGGHILDFEIANGCCEIDMLNHFTLTLPSDAEDFAATDLSIDRSNELKAVEQ